MVLVDRVPEMETFGRLLDAVRAGSSGVVVVRGEAGIGKTAILRETADRAARVGMSVARVAGVQAELDFEFAGLHQLLVPFLPGLPTLPAPQRAALEAVFGVAARPAPDRFLVGLATLTLLADAAEAQPVLCVVDDAQWLDRVSLQMLAFVCRRLLAERVGVLFGLRTGEDVGQVLEGFPQLDMGLSRRTPGASCCGYRLGPRWPSRWLAGPWRTPPATRWRLSSWAGTWPRAVARP